MQPDTKRPLLWPFWISIHTASSASTLWCPYSLGPSWHSTNRWKNQTGKLVAVLNILAQASYNKTSCGIMRSSPQHPAPSSKPALLVISHSSTQTAKPNPSQPLPLTPHIQIVVKACHFPLWEIPWICLLPVSLLLLSLEHILIFLWL